MDSVRYSFRPSVYYSTLFAYLIAGFGLGVIVGMGLDEILTAIL